jgi:hypothetical protein
MVRMGGWRGLVVRFWVISMEEKVKDFSAMMRELLLSVVMACVLLAAMVRARDAAAFDEL